MTLRALGAASLVVCLSCSGALAAHQHRPLQRVSCTEVRYYVARYSAAVAETYARSHGATDAQIDRARHCLASNG